MSKMYKARAGLACEIAGLHPDRFNEAVAAGHYGCAPPTRQGVARVFDEIDIVGQIVFSELLREGVSIGTCGAVACDVMGTMRKSPDAKFIFEIRGALSHFCLADNEFDPAAYYPGVGRFARVRRWPVGEMREYIRGEIELHLNTAG